VEHTPHAEHIRKNTSRPLHYTRTQQHVGLRHWDVRDRCLEQKAILSSKKNRCQMNVNYTHDTRGASPPETASTTPGIQVTKATNSTSQQQLYSLTQQNRVLSYAPWIERHTRPGEPQGTNDALCQIEALSARPHPIFRPPDAEGMRVVPSLSPAKKRERLTTNAGIIQTELQRQAGGEVDRYF